MLLPITNTCQAYNVFPQNSPGYTVLQAFTVFQTLPEKSDGNSQLYY